MFFWYIKVGVDVKDKVFILVVNKVLISVINFVFFLFRKKFLIVWEFFWWVK